jgi:NAD(P)-dependent dehydrogenase (short-subunit alcohol dehydrogenase family)
VLEDEGLIEKLKGKVIVITGCSSGLGIETARALKATGARLLLTARNIEKGKQALEGILEPGTVDLLNLDLESLDSVGACAEEIKRRTTTLNILINNAGVRHTPKGKTRDGLRSSGADPVGHKSCGPLLSVPAPLALISSDARLPFARDCSLVNGSL